MGKNHPSSRNSTLSEISTKGADLLIICPGAFIEYAEQIADIHRSHDSLTVATATLSQVYAEFSDALPDPSACRNTVIKFYNSSSKPLRNVLFIGLYLSDVRGINAGTHAADATIAVQCPTIHRSHGYYALPDFLRHHHPQCRPRQNRICPRVGWRGSALPFYNDADARSISTRLNAIFQTRAMPMSSPTGYISAAQATATPMTGRLCVSRAMSATSAIKR